MYRYSYILLTVCLLFPLAACSNALTVPPDTLAHMISLNKDGKTFDINNRFLNTNKDQQLDDHLDYIYKNLATAFEKHREDLEILLFIHGGLVSKETAAKKATRILEEIEKDNAHRIGNRPYMYPIFINWESGMMPAYWDHLVFVRQGRKAEILGPLSAPVYGVADIGRGVTRLPITYGYQGWNMVKGIDVATPDQIARFNQDFSSGTDPNAGISLGRNRQSTLARYWDKTTYLFPGFMKILSTPTLDIIGKSGWDNMLRRTKHVFRSPSDFSQEEKENLETFAELQSLRLSKQSQGGLSKLMRKLQEFKRDQHIHDDDITITIIGHSMGTIIASEIVRYFNQDNCHDGHTPCDFIYDHIVFMAAAATIRDVEEAIVPYLTSHAHTKFYNLTLHPYAEENEKVLVDMAPRGSLLVWIDDFAANPETLTDLTVGKWNNAIQAWPFIPKTIRDRITLKGFGIQDPQTNTENIHKPQTHGSFNDVEVKFWRRAFWNRPPP